jgi:TPR repeat protein
VLAGARLALQALQLFYRGVADFGDKLDGIEMTRTIVGAAVVSVCAVAMLTSGCSSSTPPADTAATHASSLQEVRTSAEQGDATAQYNLAVAYDSGESVPQDYAEAVKWYRKAADQGYPSAQSNLGNMYENGRGVQQNPLEAAKWYRKAAEQGLAAAQYNLGIMYANGQGVPRDAAESTKWFRKAAEHGRTGP